MENAARAYLRVPTRDRAIALLNAAGVSVPYSSLEQVTMRSNPQARATVKRGGTGAGAGAGDGSGTQTDTGNDVRFHNLARLDVLKDLYDPDTALSETIVDMVLADTQLTVRERKRIVTACTQTGSSLSRTIESIFLRPNHIQMDGPVFRIEEDGAIYNIIHDAWVGSSGGKEEVLFVLDGVLRGCVSGEQDIVKSMVVFAFLMIVLGDLGDVNISYMVTKRQKTTIVTKPKPNGVKRVVFLCGIMQTIDIPENPAFMQDWIEELDGLVNWADRVELRHLRMEDLPAPYDSKFKLGNTGLHVGGANVPFKAAQIPRIRRGSEVTQHVDDLAANCGLPYTKKYLNYVFQQYDKMGVSERDSRMQFLKLLMDVNFFRDAYYADVAIGLGAIYLTFDRLAYTYFHIRSNHIQDEKEYHGMLLVPHGIERAELGIC